ncbi:MAG: ATP-binding protein [Wenzhouxiangella sp.]
MMYRRRLVLSLGAFLLIILIQGLTALWVFDSVNRHIDRARLSQQMLTELLEFRADSKRLKVWLAEYLITDKRDTGPRDELFVRMLAQLDRLHGLADARLRQGLQDEWSALTMEKVENIDLLRGNVESLQRGLQTREIERLQTDAERWQTLVVLFDKFQGTDIAQLVNDSIQLQQSRNAQAEAAARQALRVAFVTLLTSVALGLLLFFALSTRLSRHLKQPLERLLAGTDRIASGDYSQAIPETGSSEFANLARRFNRMAGAVQQAEARQRQLQDATEDRVHERTAQLEEVVSQLQEAEVRQQRFVMEISHELRTPATTILGEAELALRSSAKADPRRQNLQHIVECCRELSSRIEDLLMLSRGHHSLISVRLRRQSVQAVFAHVAERIARQVSHHPVALKVRALEIEGRIDPDRWTLLVDLEKLDLVCRIVTENALQYRCESQELELLARVGDEQLQIELIDQGLGLQPDEADRLFERHFRGRAARTQRPDGLGIGLPIARSLMQAHDGDIRLESNQPRGARVILSLPCFEPESAAA